MRPYFFLVFAVALRCASADDGGASNEKPASVVALISEMNLARQNPSRYADFVADLRSNLHGNIMILPGHTRIRTKEGTAALDEAIRFLRSAQPLAPFAASPGMSRAAAAHCADQAAGGFGHGGSDSSNPGSRMNATAC